MADNDQYDPYDNEYQFTEHDAGGSEPMDESPEYRPASESKANFFASNNIRRNALIVVILVILAMVIYKFMGSFFAQKKTPVQADTKPVASAQTKITPPPQPERVQPIQAIPTQATTSPQTEQKLSALEVSQQTLRSDVGAVNNQLTGISSNVSEMANQIARLNDVIVAMSAKIDEQSREIDQLMVRTKPKPVKKVIQKISIPVTKYHLQAVIPGRAWLISSKGTTLTIRDGSSVPGYGEVKLIDPLQGRVVTSSGQIIRFSQNDS